MKKVYLNSGSISNNFIKPKYLNNYFNSDGLTELKNILKKKFGKIDKDILLTSSATESLFLVFLYAQQENIKVFVQSPSYFGVIRQIKALKLKVDI